MTVDEIIELSKSRKKSTANTPVVQYDEENDPSNFIIDKLPKNHVSKTPVDRDLEDVMTVESEPEKSRVILDNQRMIQDNNTLSSDNITDDYLEDEHTLTEENSILDDITDIVVNTAKGAGKNLARYSKLINKGISKGLDTFNPYTWITGEKTDLSKWFDEAGDVNDYYLKKWDNESKGSKSALAGEILLDPAILLPSGVAQTGSKLARMGKSALAGASTSAGLQYAKDYADGNNPYENVALAGGIGGALNAAIAGLTRGKVNNINGLADNYINEPYSLKKELSAIADEVSDLYKQNIRPLTKSGRQANLKDEFRNYVSSGNLNKSIDEIDSSLVSQAQNDMVGKIQAHNDSANGTFLNRYIPGTDYYRNLENYKNNIDNIKLEKSLQDAAGRQAEQMYNAGLIYNKNYNDYLKKINPTTDDIMSRYDEMYNNNSILDTSKSNHYKILEETANKYIEDISDIPLSSKYKVLNNNNYDTVMNDFKKPEFKVLNNENIDDILMADEELMTNIANIRRRNKLNAKNKSIDEVISEYPYKDTSYLEKELNKSLRNMSKSDIYKKANELKANKNKYSQDEYNRLLKWYQQEILNTSDGRKWKALKDEIKNRQNMPAPENYKSSYKPLTTARNISSMQPKSITSLKSADDTYNYNLPEINDIPTNHNTSGIEIDYTAPKALLNDIVDSKYQASVPNTNNIIMPEFSGKNIEIIDSTTGEVLNIPVELLDIIKKKALMNY